MFLAVVAAAAYGTRRLESFLCAELRRRAPAAIGGEVEIGACSLEAFHGRISVADVKVKKPGELELAATEIELGVTVFGPPWAIVKLVRPRGTYTLPQTRPNDASLPPRPSKCFLSTIAALPVAELEIEDGEVTLTDGKQSLSMQGLSGMVNNGGQDLQLLLGFEQGKLLRPGEKDFPLGALSAKMSANIRRRTVRVSSLKGMMPGLGVEVSGNIDRLCDPTPPRLDLQGELSVVLEELPQLHPALRGTTGFLRGTATVAGAFPRPRATLVLEGRELGREKLNLGSFLASFTLVWPLVTLENLTIPVGTGNLRAAGNLTIAKGMPFSVAINANELPVGRALTMAGVANPPVEFPLSAAMVVTGQVRPTLTAAATIGMRSGPFRLLARPASKPPILQFSAAQGNARLTLVGTNLTLDELNLDIGPSGTSKLQGKGAVAFDKKPTVDADLQFKSLDLRDFGPIVGTQVAGVGTLDATIRRRDGALEIAGVTALRDTRWGRYRPGELQGTLRYDGASLSVSELRGHKGATDYRGSLDMAFAPDGSKLKILVDAPAAQVSDLVEIASLDGSMFRGSAALAGEISGPTADLQGRLRVALTDLEIAKRKMGTGDLALRLEGGNKLAIEALRLRGDVGVTTAAGMVDFAGPLDVDVAISEGLIEELVDPEDKRVLPVRGSFSLLTELRGTLAEPTAKAEFTTGGMLLRRTRIGASALKAEWADGRATISGALFDGATVSAKVATKGSYEYQGVVDLREAELGPFVPRSVGTISARVSGRLAANGEASALRQSVATANLSSVALVRGDLSASTADEIDARYEDETLSVKPFTIRGRGNELSLEGSIGKGGLDANAHGTLELSPFAALVPKLSQLRGRLDFTASATGTLERPVFSGSAQLAEANFAVGWMRFSDLRAAAEFAESGLAVRDIEAILNEGKVRANGNMSLNGFTPQNAVLTADLDGVRADIIPDAPATVKGTLNFSSETLKTWQVTGDLLVEKMIYSKSLGIDALLASAKRGVDSGEAPTTTFNLGVGLKLGNEVRVDNNLARSRLEGTLRVTGTDLQPVILGTVSAAGGSQAFYRNNTFDISRGTIEFDQGMTQFDLSASTQVRDYTVFLKGYGKTSDPKITLSSDPALSESDVVSLLTLGFISRDRLDTQSSAGLAAGALFQASGLDRQVRRFLDQQIGLKDQALYFTTTFNEVTGALDPAVAWESRIFRNDLKLSLIQPVTGRGTQAKMEYFINQRTSARLKWDNQTPNTTFGNPGVEMRVRFEWE